jgi:hypothetical protein
MKNDNDENKHKNISKTLGELQKVSAPPNFEANLMRKIRSGEIEKREKGLHKLFLPNRIVPSLGLIAIAIIIFFVVDVNSEKLENPLLMDPKVREDVVAVSDDSGMNEIQEEIDKQNTVDEKKVVEEPTVMKKDQRRDKSLQKKTAGRITEMQDADKITGGEKSGQSMEGLSKTENRPMEIATVDSLTMLKSKESEIPPTKPVSNLTSLSTGKIDSVKQEFNFRQVQLNATEQNVVNQLKEKVQSEQKSLSKKKQ